MNRLSFVGAVEMYNAGRTFVPFLDFVVDGVSLRTLAEEAGVGRDFVTPLCRAWVPSAVVRALDVFTGGTVEGELADALICRVCGDRDCGALLVQVSVSKDAVEWTNWQWTDYETKSELVAALPTFTFDRVAYEQLLRSSTDTLSAMPYEPPAEQQRTTMPWKWGWRLPRRSR